MANLTRNFVAGRMNKMYDERVVPNGEYIDALNIRMGSTESSEIGVIENTKGNIVLTEIQYQGEELSQNARCIGAFEDGAKETLYWFVHDPSFAGSPTGKLDLVLSYNTNNLVTTYHLISVNDGGGINTTLNFDSKFLITGVNKIENLLYFTDGLNQPRQINVEKNYANPTAGVDGFSEESVLVIKKPPVTSPIIEPLITASQDNFLEDRFICFAYRYRYADGEYSATSQFSTPSFIPNAFDYSTATALNEGMLNLTNQCNITYNSGGPLVKSIELLFKDMNSSVIKVIEKIDKSKDGLADDTEYTYNFSNSKIFTILPDSEILRLYDNVPIRAEAQTMMGNRLVYGNYTEGYDLKDAAGNPTKLEYSADIKSQKIGLKNLQYTLSNGAYTFGATKQVPLSTININLTGVELKAGARINIFVRFSHSSFSGGSLSEDTATQSLEFTYVLPQSFTSVYALATSTDFQEKIGTASSIQTVADSCNGTTFTDAINCIIPNELSGLFKYSSGIDSAGQPIKIVSSPSSKNISLQIPAMEFVDDPTGAAITQRVYEYYKFENADVSFQEVGNISSLHSNRGYEVGIIYMDEYNRMSTALVSPNNTVHVPCELSEFKNQIDITIPTAQVAPSWATRYKFCIKPDKKDYDIIYSNFFFRDPTSGADYFLLEGQNSQKIEEGDELIVKADTQGPRDTCTWTTVLEKKAQQRDFLDPKPVDASGNEITYVPAGTYMKLRANNFSTEVGDLPFVDYGQAKSEGDGCRQIDYPIDTEDPNNPGTYIDYTVPAGSRIYISIRNYRRGNEDTFLGEVPKKLWQVDSAFTASQDYNNFKEWFEGDNIPSALESQANTDGTGVVGPQYNPSDQLINCNVAGISTTIGPSVFPNVLGRSCFKVRSTEGYGNGDNKKARLSVHIKVLRANGTIIWESDPQDAEPDLWYESSESFAIGPNGEHYGNIQNQDFATNTPAFIETDFFNCYSFGNGVESYKIQDSIAGKELTLGNRATTTDSKIYSQEDRFSDLTYSGVYNLESNINKLNEFNGGLLNFKNLEQSFGPVMKLFGRETDILVLQEDKISYVLAGKNLLSDASGGSSLTSVPEVLGTQIARIEEFGISHNPESFAQWGSDKYFTDAKRGAVIQLKGSSASNEQLDVISRNGMRTWFRDLFNTSFQTQKLGGFDPYMNEYVLSSNSTEVPIESDCEECGITQNITINENAPYELCYNLGDLVGLTDISYQVTDVTGTFSVSVLYNGVVYDSGIVSSSGVLTFNKDVVLEEDAVVTIVSSDSVTLNLTVNCPNADSISIVLVQLSNDNEAGQFIHNEYRWEDGYFTSPLHSTQVEFLSGNSPVVSWYDIISGKQGGGVIPSNTATVTMLSNRFGTDDYVFNINANKFRYLRTNTLYQNNQSDIASLLAASNVASPITPPQTKGDTAYRASYPMPSTGTYLYMIWDYRESTPTDLCFGATINDACCGCVPQPTIYVVENCETQQEVVIDDPNGTFTIGDTVQYVLGVSPNEGTYVYCGTIVNYGTTPTATLYSENTAQCGSVNDCNFDSSISCSEYTVSTNSPLINGVSYIDCNGDFVQTFVGGEYPDSITFCAETGTVNAGALNVFNNGPCP